MLNEMFGVFYNESDGYTYSGESLMGVFSSEQDAETALLLHIEQLQTLVDARKKRDESYVALRGRLREANLKNPDKPKNIEDFRLGMLEIEAEYSKAYESLGLDPKHGNQSILSDTDLGNWNVRRIAPNVIHFEGA